MIHIVSAPKSSCPVQKRKLDFLVNGSTHDYNPQGKLKNLLNIVDILQKISPTIVPPQTAPCSSGATLHSCFRKVDPVCCESCCDNLSSTVGPGYPVSTYPVSRVRSLFVPAFTESFVKFSWFICPPRIIFQRGPRSIPVIVLFLSLPPPSRTTRNSRDTRLLHLRRTRSCRLERPGWYAWS